MDNKERPEAPETVNREQKDEGQNLGTEDYGDPQVIGLSDRANRSRPEDIVPDDTPDLVEKMEEMLRSGRIDNDAYAGEPAHDDEPDTYGDGDDDATG